MRPRFSIYILKPGSKLVFKTNFWPKFYLGKIKEVKLITNDSYFSTDKKVWNNCNNVIKHFQQRMSWLPQRWRTQRNAIRHANCTIQWVIKTLNATCTSFGEYVCSSVCSSPPKKHPQSVLSESTVWSHSFGVECVQMEWMSNPFKLLKVMIISLVTILKPSNLRHYCQKFRMCLLKRDWSKSPLKILIGPRISQEYPLNLSI